MHSSLSLILGMTAAAAAVCFPDTATVSEDFRLVAKTDDKVFTLGASHNGTEQSVPVTVFLYSVEESLAAKAYTNSTFRGTSLNVRDGTTFAGMQISSVFNTYDDTVTVLGYDGYQPGPKWFVQSDNEIVHEHSQAYEQFYLCADILDKEAAQVLRSGTPKKDKTAPDGCTGVKLYKATI